MPLGSFAKEQGERITWQLTRPKLAQIYWGDIMEKAEKKFRFEEMCEKVPRA